jgi:hypothetical protein
MKLRVCRKMVRTMCIAVVLIWAGVAAVAAQSTTGTLRGQVADPSGAGISGATVLATNESGDSKGATTNKEGTYEIAGLAAGKYKIDVIAPGFAMLSKTDIVLTGGQITRVNVALTIQVQQEKVVVNDTTTQVDVNPANNANTIVLQGKDLEALSDDPDELQSELQALAGPSAGPNGGQIYIDGFTGGQLPPKASIREIRINQNPFSAEYDKLGYGRIEIFTKPGTDKLHGQFMISGNTAAFNARNPFERLPTGTSPPGYNSEQYSGNIGGAINKKTSFVFNIEQRNIGALNIVTATDPNPFTVAVPNPQTRTNLSPRIDSQLSPNNSLTARYQYFRESESNDGVGQFNEAEVGTNFLSTEHTLQLTDTQTINATTINEIRFQYVRDSSLTTPVNSAPNVTVGGAFSNNGSGGGNMSDIQNRYEVQEMMYKNFRKHSVKFGGRFRATKDLSTTESNFNGAFFFNNLAQYNSFVQGQAGIFPTYYTQTAGTPTTLVSWLDVGVFAQDDWKVRQNITISYGLRFETQNNFSDKHDFAPRIGVAWGIGGSAKNPPKTVLRAGFGIFYDRFPSNLVLQQDRFNGVTQLTYQVQNPAFYLSNIPPVNQLPGTTTALTIYQPNLNLHAPYTMQTGITLERQLTKSANIAVTYLNSRGVHQFYTDNLNPADPVTGIRPDGNDNLYQYQSDGTFKQNQLIVNGSVRMGSKLSLFGYYTLNYANSDTSGAGSFPSLPGNISEDYGRASFDIRHRLFMGGTVGLPKGFRLSPFLIASSGIPFNITTGTDPFKDSQFNLRPVLAPSCAAATYVTQFGCFNPETPGAGYIPIPVNYGEGPGRFSLNLRLSKTFGFGPAIENAGSGGGNPMAGGTFGRGPGGGGRGGPGGGRGMDAGSTNRRYGLTLSVNARNLFNNVNLATPVGNLSSPLFGESNGLAGRPYSDSTSNRRVDLQLTFTF